MPLMENDSWGRLTLLLSSGYAKSIYTGSGKSSSLTPHVLQDVTCGFPLAVPWF